MYYRRVKKGFGFLINPSTLCFISSCHIYNVSYLGNISVLIFFVSTSIFHFFQDVELEEVFGALEDTIAASRLSLTSLLNKWVWQNIDTLQLNKCVHKYFVSAPVSKQQKNAPLAYMFENKSTLCRRLKGATAWSGRFIGRVRISHEQYNTQPWKSHFFRYKRINRL